MIAENHRFPPRPRLRIRSVMVAVAVVALCLAIVRTHRAKGVVVVAWFALAALPATYLTRRVMAAAPDYDRRVALVLLPTLTLVTGVVSAAVILVVSILISLAWSLIRSLGS